MNEQNFKSLNELIVTYQQGRHFFKTAKKNYKLNYEEVLILNYLYNCKENEVTAKAIAQYSELKPYYLTKALQKLIKMDFLNKKRSNVDERTVVVYINQAQRDKINQLIDNLQKQF
ncbi:MarR family transcriptional regulator [Staphylococcus equorum]|uniref:MarR family transcriptional regulator n=1 Tax=Staphylococcus equorum TaxID=246432 RepID=A0A9X4LAG8_9STAP|nr:MarR family transcriptional regulator [Staphylococcus equorum]MDG0843579.1 MarR family transcriptional regulator [Staphylococcus equorum]MDG0859867.1 MarR family transcriptional regulator [Staphylococcus equorum]